MKEFKWRIEDGTNVPCQKDPGDTTQFYYAKAYDNTCVDRLDDEAMEVNCTINIRLKFKQQKDYELYKKNLEEIRDLSGWKRVEA